MRAKPAIPVAGEPIIRRIIRWLVANAVTQVTLNLHHLPETLARVVGDGSDLGANVRYSWEQPTVLGSAGGPRQALDIIGADSFFLINGDTLTDLDLGALGESHMASGALVTLALVPNVDPLRYGGVRLASDGRVVGFARRGPAAAGSFHFIGAQVASRSVFAGLTAGQPVNSIGGCYDELLAREPGAIRGFVADAQLLGYWHRRRLLAHIVNVVGERRSRLIAGAHPPLGEHRAVHPLGRCGSGGGSPAGRMYRDRRRACAGGSELPTEDIDARD